MTIDPIRQQLDGLPPPPLPPGLWPRLARRRRRQLVIRRTGMALALGALMVSPLALLWRAQDAQPAQAIDIATIADPTTKAAADAVSAIDQALQNAYARGASDDEVAPLWEVRQRLAKQAHPRTSNDPS